MLRLRSVRWLVPLVGLAIIAAACSSTKSSGTGGNAAPSVKEGGKISYAADQEPTGFNINTSKDNGTSVQNIIETVFPAAFHAHPDFTVQIDGALLDSAQLTNQSPQTVVYKIKANANWSDGTPISADDFIYLWEGSNGKNKDIDIAATTGYDQIASVTGSDSGKTVTAVFSKPFADWRSLFSNILPAHYAKQQPGDAVKQWNNGFDKHGELIPSGGPFVISNYTVGNSLTLKRNDKYFGPKSHLDEIVFRFLPESTTQPAALQNSEVDLIYPQPQLDEVAKVKGLQDVTAEINFGLSFEHLDFNFKNAFLADLKVRQAIATALDREKLLTSTVKQFSDKASVLGNRVWLTGQKEYQDHSGNFGKGDAAGAAQLLESAGFAKGADGYYAKGGKTLELRFSTTAGNKLRETQGLLFQSQMKAAGIKITIRNIISKTFFGVWLPEGDYDIADFAWVGTPFTVSSNRDIYRTDGGSNYGKYSNTSVDQMFEQANAELDTVKSAALGNQIDQQVWADMATIPLYQKPTFIAWRKTYTGIGDNATSEGPFWNANLWAQKAA